MNKQNTTTEALNNEQDYAPENPEWGKVRLIMRDDTVGGGLNGNLNKPIIDLTKRMAYIKKQNEDITEQAKTGFVLLSSFEEGATLTLVNEVLLYKMDGQYYRWTGNLPKAVDANSTPETSGGIGGGKWVLIGDSSLRAVLNSNEGATIVRTSNGETVQQVIDKILIKNDLLDNNQLHLIMAKMAAGETVKIACYGDSTTDGAQTTDWKKNVPGTDHNLDAPNAWPAKLQTLLRAMYKNDNIYVHNAGFSAQRIDNGWATDNYEKNIIENQYYGKCDLVFINFGLNDVARVNRLHQHITQTELLIRKIIEHGSTPILLSCNLTYLSKAEGDTRDKHEVTQQYNQAKYYIAQRYNIPFFDLSNAMLHWLQKNDQHKWGELQVDGLHFGDIGHMYQATWLASRLYSNTVIINDGLQYQSINFMDSKANSDFGFANCYNGTNTKYKSNVLLNGETAQKYVNQKMMTIYVWCETNNVSCVYRQLSHENNTGTHIEYENVIDGSTNTYKIYPRLDMTNHKNLYGGSDIPRFITNLKFGLNKISYIYTPEDTPDDGIYFGFFDFVKNYESNLKPRNLLAKTGVIRSTIDIAANTSIVDYIKHDLYDIEGHDTVQLLVDGKKTYLYLEFDGALLNGIVLTQARGMKAGYDDGLMLYKDNIENLSLHVIRTDMKTHSTTYATASTGIVPFFIDETYCKVILEFYIDNSNNMIVNSLNNDNYKLLSSHIISPLFAFPFSGVFGNVFSRNVSQSKGNKTIFNITRAEVWYNDII